MAEPDTAPGTLRICVVYSPGPRQVVEKHLSVKAGCTAGEALRLSGMLSGIADADLVSGGVGIWGKKASPTQPLRNNDRIEIYRPLRVDPKVARRERFKKQGAKKSGLFSTLRDGAKAGY